MTTLSMRETSNSLEKSRMPCRTVNRGAVDGDLAGHTSMVATGSMDALEE